MRYVLSIIAVYLGSLALTGCRRSKQELSFNSNLDESTFAPLVRLPPPPPVSTAGYQLILDYEVGGGERYYSRRLARPTWPGEQSGVTVGVGYDCGYYSRATIVSDWHELRHRGRLAETSRITGLSAKALIPKLSDILIEWGLAEGVFNRVTLTRFWQLTRRSYPGFDDLRPNAQAALVSLTFNRGASMTGDRRREMREIRDCITRLDYTGMARANRESIRIWRGTSIEAGMARRRDAEARLMETP